MTSAADACLSCGQVRANSLQELVYKQGQAGVTKASVSIVFNNTDKANSPVSYENFDKIAVTRQVRVLLWLMPVHTCPTGCWLAENTNPVSTLTLPERVHGQLCHEGTADLLMCMQLVVGGRSKYLINGHVAQPG